MFQKNMGKNIANDRHCCGIPLLVNMQHILNALYLCSSYFNIVGYKTSYSKSTHKLKVHQ